MDTTNNAAARTATEIADECMGGGGVEVLSVEEQMRAWWRCSHCGKILKLRKNASGFAAQEAAIPRHARPKPKRTPKLIKGRLV